MWLLNVGGQTMLPLPQSTDCATQRMDRPCRRQGSSAAHGSVDSYMQSNQPLVVVGMQWACMNTIWGICCAIEKYVLPSPAFSCPFLCKHFAFATHTWTTLRTFRLPASTLQTTLCKKRDCGGRMQVKVWKKNQLHHPWI